MYCNLFFHKNAPEAVGIINELANISEWLAAIVGKYNLIISNKKIVRIDITFNGRSLKEIDNANYLGILIDN